jgi:adenine-specific DNA-methyltransferase
MRRKPPSTAHGAYGAGVRGVKNVIVKKVVKEFCPRFAPGGLAIHVAGPNEGPPHLNVRCLRRLGVALDTNLRMPDVIVHLPRRNRLFLIQAASIQGPVTPERLAELELVFGVAGARLLIVTACLSRGEASNYLADLAWGTAVWVADAPAHMIHFDGGYLPGP